MKNILRITLVVVLLIIIFTACTVQSEQNSTALHHNLHTSEPEIKDFVQEPNNPSEDFEILVTFEYAGGDERKYFLEGLDRKLTMFSMIEDRFVEYLKLSEEEFGVAIMKIFGDDALKSTAIWDRTNSVLELPTLLSYIVHFDIPDEVVIDAIKEHDDWHVSRGLFVSYGGEPFTDKDIAALLSRDAEIVAIHFASPYAIVIEDKVYPPAWLYTQTAEDWERAGITPEMIAEKLELYAQFDFTDEAAQAFEAKLSAFTGTDVSL